MSAPLAETLSRDLCGRVAWVGLGHAGLGDDGVGVRLAEELRAAFCPEVFCAGTEVEKWIPDIRLGAFHHVVFLDAVDAGAESGSVVWLSQDELRVRYPQVSTHKLALSTLAGILSNACATRVWLLGIQVGRLDGEGLSPEVEKTEGSLRELILALMNISAVTSTDPRVQSHGREEENRSSSSPFLWRPAKGRGAERSEAGMGSPLYAAQTTRTTKDSSCRLP